MWLVLCQNADPRTNPAPVHHSQQNDVDLVKKFASEITSSKHSMVQKHSSDDHEWQITNADKTLYQLFNIRCFKGLYESDWVTYIQEFEYVWDRHQIDQKYRSGLLKKHNIRRCDNMLQLARPRQHAMVQSKGIGHGGILKWE